MQDKTSKHKALLRNIILYGAIGVFSASLDAFIFYVLVHMIYAPPIVANLISMPIAIFVSFTLNRKFNFKVKDNAAKRGLIYFSVDGVGMLISQFMQLGGAAIGATPFTVKIVSIPIVAFFQFTMHKLVSFGVRFRNEQDAHIPSLTPANGSFSRNACSQP